MKELIEFLFFNFFKIDQIFLYKSQRFNFLIEKSKFINSSNSIDIQEGVNLMVPIGCSKPLIRIGGEGDGSYLVPDDLEKIDACFSPGTSLKKTFEDQLFKQYKIQSVLSDGSIDKKSLNLIEGYQVFQKKWVNDFNDKSTTTLQAWIDESNLSYSNNLLLQMDIEGSEYPSLLNTPNSCLKQFKIMVIEFHHLNRLDNERFLNQIFLPLMQKILLNFDCVHAHPNNCLPAVEMAGYKIPQVIELTFYRKDCNKGEKRVLIPHPNDIINCDSKPVLYLGEPWI